MNNDYFCHYLNVMLKLLYNNAIGLNKREIENFLFFVLIL